MQSTKNLPVEVVENVLLHLSSFDLLVATAVCKHWRQIIESSKRIRDQLLSTYNTKNISRWNWHTWSDWHFRTEVSNGTLFVLRSQMKDVEVLLFAPASSKAKATNHLRVLDERLSFTWTWSLQDFTGWVPRPVDGNKFWTPDLEWKDRDGHLVTRVRCKPAPYLNNHLRSYLLAFYVNRMDLIVDLGDWPVGSRFDS